MTQKMNPRRKDEKVEVAQKVNRGAEPAPQDLIDATLEMVQKTCTTNNHIYIIRNVVELIKKGFDNNLRNIMYLLQENGSNAMMIVKDDKTTFEYQKEYGVPASNIGYALNPIASGIFKNKIDLSEISIFQEQSGKLLVNLKETEKLAIDLIAKNNISTDSLPNGFKKIIEARKVELKSSIKAKKETEKVVAKPVQDVQKTEEQKKQQEAAKKEKIAREKEKLKAKREARKQRLKEFISSTPKLEDKTKDEWIKFGVFNKIKGIETKESIEDIFNEIVRIARAVAGNLPKEEKVIPQTKEEPKVTQEALQVLPPKEAKTKDEWIAFAKENKIDLAGATLKDDIYEFIKLDYEEKMTK